ncbi:hypothetical protein ACFRAQ_02740 [Nocardia sp. NPDC056611]|uniref:hypothetical protein n=1 Tax=Nocardia sp. NPDC056611 TaxID=3345877 RepID=UPI00366A577C
MGMLETLKRHMPFRKVSGWCFEWGMPTDESDTSILRQAENYWVPRDDNLRVHYYNHPQPHPVSWEELQHGSGTVAARFETSNTATNGHVVLVVGGHHKANVPCSTLWMDLDTAEELVIQLLAALTDGRRSQGALLDPIPFQDTTFQSCQCNDCIEPWADGMTGW